MAAQHDAAREARDKQRGRRRHHFRISAEAAIALDVMVENSGGLSASHVIERLLLDAYRPNTVEQVMRTYGMTRSEAVYFLTMRESHER